MALLHTIGTGDSRFVDVGTGRWVRVSDIVAVDDWGNGDVALIQRSGNENHVFGRSLDDILTVLTTSE